MAMKMCHKLKPKEAVVIEVVRMNDFFFGVFFFYFCVKNNFQFSLIQSETPAAAALKSIATTLKIGKPPNNAPINVVFEKINSKLTEVLQKCGKIEFSNISSDNLSL